MTTSTLPSSRVRLVRLITLLALLALATPGWCAQFIFWPFNLFPASSWSTTYSDSSTIAATVPTVGTITSRHLQLSTFSNPITLPGPGASATWNNASTRFDSETSLDGGANWAPYQGFGPVSFTLRHTNESAGVRHFEWEITSQNVPVNGSYGAATVRESPSLASLGQLVVMATNGGFFYRGSVSLHLEVSLDGANWFPFSPAASLELIGPAGTPALLSITRAETTVSLCWSTEAVGEYQLQRTSELVTTNWTNVGLPLAGTGGEICVPDTFTPGTNQFYRVKLAP